METVILEMARLYGLPGALAAAVLYYLVKRGPERSVAQADPVLSELQQIKAMLAEDRKTMGEIRDALIRVEARQK
jgi:hypothetical protein